MALVGSINRSNSLQGSINSGGVLTGTISNVKYLGGQITGMRGLRGEKGDAGTTTYSELADKPQIEGVTLEGDKTFAELNLESLTNEEIEELLNLSV